MEQEKKHNRPVANVDYSNSLGATPIPYFQEFESRVLISNKIVAALKNPSVNIVGVYGMGGAGKTTLAEKIGADLQRDSTFSYVVLATVSEKQNQLESNYKPDMLNIQEQIAGGFKIHLQGQTDRDRAVELREQLQKKDKVLIILDDIWSRFEIKDVGIPIGNVHKNFKILMTSRSQDVLLKQMDSTNNFGLDSLSYHDAWTLFDTMVGGDIEHSKCRSTAEQVVKQCGGIPILLVTIARALRNEASESWEDALSQLKQFDGENIVEEAYKMIEVSYKFLKSEELKKLLLLCAQMNHRDILEEDLLKYSMGLNLFKGCKKLKEVRNRLHSDLKGCCLLQDGNEQGVVKMHDVVHKFVTFVAFKDHNVFSVANDDELEEWPSKEQFEKFTAISLSECHRPPDQMLSLAFDNPKLESFLMIMSDFDASFQIPDNFFKGMKELKLMDLTFMSLSPILVSSFEVLVKLRTLCLDSCELSDISVIGELPMLQALSLVGSSIVLVPKEIGNLGSTLKLLDLSECKKLKRIAADVIFRLTLLEDMRIGESYKEHWGRLEGDDKTSNIVDEINEAGMASLEEFKNLQNLINLEIHIHDHAEMFPKNLVFTKLETFKIFLGQPCLLRRMNKSTRILEVNNSTTVEFDGEGTKALMTCAESLLLTRVRGCVSLSEMDPKGFPELKHLKVRYGVGVQYIVKKNCNNCIFPKLETLDLSSFTKLERICDDYPLPVGSFENLRVIEVNRCSLSNDLFSSNLAGCLLRLMEIIVIECRRVKSIIGSRERELEEEIEIGFTHQLRVLKLYDLPRFVSFCNVKQLEKFPPPTHLFSKKITFPKLEDLVLKGIEIDKIWEGLAITAEGTCWLQNLTSLHVGGCDDLSYLFTSSMVESLAKLEQLEVDNCKNIEEIVFAATREGEIEGERLLLFPKLEYVRLTKLPKVKRFCHANLLECQSLQLLELRECPLLVAFNGDNESSLFDEKTVFPKLEELELSGINIKKIWDVDHLAEGTTCWFQNLTSLEVFDCEDLTYLLTSSMVKSFAQLKKLKVRNCKSMEEIVASKEMSVACCDSLEEIVVIEDQSRELANMEEYIVFENLNSLDLQNMNSLMSFCSASDCNFRFPSLNAVVVDNCPKMEFFSKVALSTPKLIRVWSKNWVEEDDEGTQQNETRWEGDLNSTIR